MLKIARTLADAAEGDLLWHYDSQRSVYVEGTYRGRGFWSVVRVQKVGRLSIEAESKYDRQTGAARGQRGYSPTRFIMGADERAAKWLNDRRHALAREVQDCNDLEVLKTVAFALGQEGPPDFSVASENPGGPDA